MLSGLCTRYCAVGRRPTVHERDAIPVKVLCSLRFVRPVLVVLGVLMSAGTLAYASPVGNDSLDPARAVIHRLIPGLENQITLSLLRGRANLDAFRISGEMGHIRVEGTTGIAALSGVNWYLKYIAYLQISTNGDQIAWQGMLPAPAQPVEQQSPYPFRYALNQNTDGYSTPYWQWPRWQREIDVLALSGVNTVLVERGMDAVLYLTFRDFGYSDLEIRQWITQPAHQNWQLMGNMCCFNEPISRQLLDRRIRSAKKMIARLRELGITPVFPGYYGIVPADFNARYHEAHVVPQGAWNGFERPAWLDPRDPMFAKVAASFYRHQQELFGKTSIYDIEVFQEGGASGDVPISAAARSVQESLNRAHPGALWMTLAWQDNPSKDLLAGVDRSRLLIIDIEQGRTPHEQREADFEGARYLFGGLWEFGGRTTLGANLYDYAVRLPKMGTRPGSTMAGTAIMTEGLDTNPAAFDLFTEMAWRMGPVDMNECAKQYAARRYGATDAHAERAWKILMETVYGARADGERKHGERDAQPESLFNAQPSLTARTASTWAPDELRYRPQLLNQALAELLAAGPALRKTATYQYDLVDVARQVLANWSRETLPKIRDAFQHHDRLRFHSLADEWLKKMLLQDELLTTNSNFMVGRWLEEVPTWADDDEERARLEYDARSILTTWGNRTASESGLHDYGNKDWAGLTRDYYRGRWQLYFTSLEEAMQKSKPPAAIDWFQVGEKWNRSQTTYPTEAQGDPWLVASHIALDLGIAPASASGGAR